MVESADPDSLAKLLNAEDDELRVLVVADTETSVPWETVPAVEIPVNTEIVVLDAGKVSLPVASSGIKLLVTAGQVPLVENAGMLLDPKVSELLTLLEPKFGNDEDPDNIVVLVLANDSS